MKCCDGPLGGGLGDLTARRFYVFDLVLYPPFGLLGQDRRKTSPLAEILAARGIGRGSKVGVAGWKYFGRLETATPETWLETPSYIVDTLRALVGDSGKVVNAGAILMDASEGLRARPFGGRTWDRSFKSRSPRPSMRAPCYFFRL